MTGRGRLRARPWHGPHEQLYILLTTRSDGVRAELLPLVPGLCRRLKETTYRLKTPPGVPAKDPDLGPDVERLQRAALDSTTIDEDSRSRILEVCRRILTFGQSKQKGLDI
jgi:hypothetical protein